MEQADSVNDTDRRNYFRVDDMTILYYRVLNDDGDSDQLLSSQLSIDKLTLKSHFDALTREMKPMSEMIAQEYPKLSRYLANFDNKLNMLSEVLMNDVVDELDVTPQKVNISAGGLSFVTHEPLTPGTQLELRFVLQPENIGIYSHARVVSSKKIIAKDEGKKVYKLAVEFVGLSEDSRDQISRHVLARERALLSRSSE